MIRPHITLVFPFDSTISTEQITRHMSRAAQVLRPFTLHLRGITGYVKEYLFLNVKYGNDQLIALHDYLYTGLLAPYLTFQETYLPHLTVGQLSSEMAFAQALIEAQAVTALFETKVHEMMAYRLEHDSSGSVECSLKLLWVTEGAG